MAVKKGLGRGLNDIFEQNIADNTNGTVMLKISDIEPNRKQPRKAFDDALIAELAESISQHGVIQPLIVRPTIEGTYQIVAGERRWRASRMAGLSEVPVVIKELSDLETTELALIENLQREDLNPVEEAQGFKMLMDTYGMTQDDVAKSVGKSRSAVANSLRLLGLPDEILEMLSSGRLTSGHARALLSFKDMEEMHRASELAANGELTVRDLEKLSKQAPRENKNSEENENTKNKPSFFKEVELSMCEYLGRRVRVKADKQGRGTLEIQFFSEQDLQEFLQYFDR